MIRLTLEELNVKYKGWKRSRIPQVMEYQKQYRDSHREKQRQYDKVYYQNNKQKYLDFNKNKIKEVTFIINSIKNRPCMDCQGWFEPIQMDFDHRDPETKLADIAWLKLRSRKILLNEIKKCDVVCANCHRLRTHKGRI